MVNLEIKDLTKVYNKKKVLDNISFEVKDGEFLSILGPSGCGKTTLLKILILIKTLLQFIMMIILVILKQ